MNPNFDELREIFDLVDYDHRGFVLVEDFLEILESLHEQARGTTLYMLLTSAKANGQDKIFYEEFHELLTKKLISLDEE